MTQPIVQKIKIETTGATTAEASLKRLKTGLVDVNQAAKQTVGSANAGRVAGLGQVVGSAAGGSALPVVGQLLELGAAGGIAGLAVGAVSVALRLATGHAEAAAKAFVASGNAVRAASESSLTKTREQLEAERDAAQDLVRLREAEFQRAQASYLEARQNSDPLARVLNTDAFYESIEADFNTAKDSLTVAQDALLGLNLVLLDTSVFAADAAAAERALSDARTKYQTDEASIQVRLDSMTAAQRQERIGAIEREIAILSDVAKAEGATSETAAQLEARVLSLQQELRLATGVTDSYADALARTKAAIEALTERNDQIIDLVDQEVEAREKLFSINQDIAEIEAERAAAATKVVNETEERRAEILAESAENQQEMAEDNARELEKIQRDLNNESKYLIGERDAYGHKRAEEAAQASIDDQIASEDQQAKATAKADAKALSALEKAKNQQLTTLAEGAFRETNIKLTEARKQEVLVAQSQASQQFLATNGAISILNIHGQMWTSLEGQAFVRGQAVVNAFIAGASSRGGHNSGNGGFPTLTDSPEGRQLDARMANIAQRELNKTLTAANPYSRNTGKAFG